MLRYEKEYNVTPRVNEAEIYRQHYEDALDEIRNLKSRIKDLETLIEENKENMVIIKRRDW